MTETAEKRAKPTPGPWEWDAGDIGQDYPAPYCNVFVDAGNLIIAQVNDRFSREIGHANARLIAAAPDTAAKLDRLKVDNTALAGALEDIAKGQQKPSTRPSNLHWSQRRARAALDRLAEEDGT